MKQPLGVKHLQLPMRNQSLFALKLQEVVIKIARLSNAFDGFHQF